MFLGLASWSWSCWGCASSHSKVSDDDAGDATIDHTPQQTEETESV
jgi:hypothetical protein